MIEALNNREVRKQLQVAGFPVWLSLSQGHHLGYRKGVESCSWLARVRLRGRGYRQCYLGEADDTLCADGSTILTFGQACAKADKWFAEFNEMSCRFPAKASDNPMYPDLPPAPPFTVAHAMVDYMKWYRESRRGFERIYYAATAQIIPQMGSEPIDALTTPLIREWFEATAAMPARVRSRDGAPQQYRAKSDDPDARRKRRNTANKSLAILKAALSRAFESGWVDSDLAWRRVRKFRRVEARNARLLTKEECRLLIAALPEPLRPLAIGALVTGCRVQELKVLRAGDYVRELGRIVIQDGKGGFRRHVSLTDEGLDFFERLAHGKKATDFLFTQENGQPWGRHGHVRHFQKASAEAGIQPPATFHHLRHTYASYAAMAGIPLPVIAKQLGHRDTRMVEHYYAHLGNSYVDEVVRAKMPNLISRGDG